MYGPEGAPEPLTIFQPESYDRPDPENGALPVIVFHGINTSCASFIKHTAFLTMKNSPYGNKVYCVEYGANINSILRSINFLVKHACNLLKKHASSYGLNNGNFPPKFLQILIFLGFLLYGSSQGSIVAKGVLQTCSLGSKVPGMILSGGPNMGVLRIPNTTYEKAQKIINEIAEDLVYLPEF
jgi:hypothetical protein